MKFKSALDLIGNTPLVKLNKVVAQFECDVWAKCEFLNPGGSIKDRIAKSMVEAMEEAGRLKPGDTLVEPTSGNTGIGLALVGAVKGYRVIITMPEKMSKEKEVVLRCLGAKIVRTPTEEPSMSPTSHIGIAKSMSEEVDTVHLPDQYSNPANPAVHYRTTAEEILQDLDGKVDMFVASPGTGGTLTGVAKRLKEVNPNCIVVGADPIGSILGGGDQVLSYKVEGIGYDFFPAVFDRELVDHWVKVSDRESFLLAREIIRQEGLLVGGSSGSNLAAALKHLDKLKKGQNCVIIFPDGIRNYLSKFASDEWMLENEFLQLPDDLLNSTLDKFEPYFVELETIQWSSKLRDVACRTGVTFFMVKFGSKIVGVLSAQSIVDCLVKNPKAADDEVLFYVDKHFRLFSSSQTLFDLLVDKSHYKIIESSDRFYTLDLARLLVAHI